MSLKNRYIVLSVILILGLCGCVPEITGVQNNTFVDENISKVDSNDSHIKESFSNTFFVDADVQYPTTENVPVVLASKIAFDSDKIISLLASPQEQFERDPSSSQYDGEIYRSEQSYFFLNPGSISYGTDEVKYIKYPTDSFVGKNEIGTFNQKFAQVYQEKSLAFLEPEKVMDAVTQILNNLSINVGEEIEYYAIDFQTMQNQQESRIQRNIDIQKQMGLNPIQDPTRGYSIKENFSPEDEFYILFFSVKQNNIPITQQSYTTIAGERTMEGSTIKVLYSKNGIIELLCRGIYEQTDVLESYAFDELISVNDALKTVFENSNLILTTGSTTVTNISLEYVPVPYNKDYDKVKLTPAWCFALSASGQTKEEDNTHTTTDVMQDMIFIDAITGEEIS